MIYLIGGAPRCGKSTLSKKLAQKLGLRWFASDSLRPIALAYTPKEEYPEKFPFVGMYDDMGYDNDIFFGENSAEEILNADIVESRTIWPGLKEFIKHESIVGEGIIIEGSHLLPELVNELRSEKLFNDLRIAFLIKEDEHKILDGFVKNNSSFDWLIRNTKDEKTLSRAARMVSVYGEFFKKEAEKYGFEVFNTEDNFEEMLENANAYLMTERNLQNV